ncbi:MAG TPA: GGDEF domain-containing protein [Thermoanaerobaculia bacterium]|nr:GGDEF domain-containing protein [Thermoanaerobaculia bacterium]
MSHQAGIYSSRGDLTARLREACPDWTFHEAGEERQRCRVAILDDEDASDSKSVARLVIGERERRSGELVVAREELLRDPSRYLAFAGDLADAVLHAAQLEQEAKNLREIHELMAMTDAEEVSARITRTILGLLGLEHGTLFLHDPRHERYVVSFSNDPGYQDTNEFLPGVPSDILQQALASPALFAVSGGMVVMPLQVRDDLLGVIKVPVRQSHAIGELQAANVTRYLSAVAQVLSNIYQLTRSRDLAMRDDLTKAYNRRFFETYLDEEIERSRRYGTIFSIIFLDLDDLRMVNSFYGHLSGSRTLQEVAKRILGAVRGIDKVVRFGGDEFCVILPQTDSDQAVAVANRISRGINASALRIDSNVEVTITASFGIATYPTHAVTKDALIRQADAAMYRVKSTTKNAVGVAVVEDATRPA